MYVGVLSKRQFAVLSKFNIKQGNLFNKTAESIAVVYEWIT